MFDKLIYAACIAVSVSGCDLLDRAFGDSSKREIPQATAFFSPPPVVPPATIAPVVVAVTEPVYVAPVYIEPTYDPCQPRWREPNPCGL